MALVIVDIDNTLLDRVAAFRHWAELFVKLFDLDSHYVFKLEALDKDGMRPRAEFFELASEASDVISSSEVRDDYLARYPHSFELSSETSASLIALRHAGHVIGIATNGPPFQEAVIRHSGLAQFVDGWAISEVVGHRKPSVRIAEALAQAVGQPTDGGLVIGDSADDIGLANNLGLASAWISRGRTWPDDLTFRPSVTTITAVDAMQWALQRLSLP